MKTALFLNVVLIVACMLLYRSMDNYKTKYIDLQCINAKLDNTIKTTAKTIKDLTAVNVSQKATIALRNAENNAKDDKIKQLAVRFVNLQANYYKLKTKKSTITKKAVTRTKVKKSKVYKKPSKSPRQIARERKYKTLSDQKKKVIADLKVAYKALKRAKGIVSRKHKIKSVKNVESIISKHKSKLRYIEYKIRILK